MPPKAKDIDSRLECITTMIESLTANQASSFAKIDEKISSVSEEIAKVRTDLSDKLAKEIKTIKDSQKDLERVVEQNRLDLLNLVNDCEQHGRSRSIRISGINLSKDQRDAETVVKIAYERVIKPMLDNAYKCKNLPTPSMWEVIEYGHMLPSANNLPTVAIRLRSEFLVKDLWKSKKDFLPTLKSDGIFINPSVTKQNGKKMAELKKDPRISSVWFNRKIHFKIKDKETIFTIRRLEQQPDDFLNVQAKDREASFNTRGLEQQPDDVLNESVREDENLDQQMDSSLSKSVSLDQ